MEAEVNNNENSFSYNKNIKEQCKSRKKTRKRLSSKQQTRYYEREQNRSSERKPLERESLSLLNFTLQTAMML